MIDNFIKYVNKDLKHIEFDLKLLSHLGCVMVSVLTLSTKGHWFNPWSGQIKDTRLVFVASLLSIQHLREGAKTGGPIFRIICQGKMACLPGYYCFHEHNKNQAKHFDLVQGRVY